MAHTLETAKLRIQELTALKSGWDDEGMAIAISDDTGRTAFDLIRHLESRGLPLPGIFAIVDGGIALEWSSPQKVTSAEVSANSTFDLFDLVIEGKETKELDTDSMDEAISFLQDALS